MRWGPVPPPAGAVHHKAGPSLTGAAIEGRVCGTPGWMPATGDARVVRGLAGRAALIVTLAAMLVATAGLPRPAAALSLLHLAPHERLAMLKTCRHLDGQDEALCRRVVDDPHVIANDKRSCLWAMTALLQGSTWERVKSLPATLTCSAGLRRAGYPVRSILRRLNGGG